MWAASGLLLPGLLLFTSPGLSATYYVSPEGEDNADGLSPGTALRTIQAGVDRLQPGDTLLIMGGVYRETITFRTSGRPGAPITLRPYNAERVLITGCDPISGWTLHDPERGIWKAAMPWTLGPGRNQVFAGERVMIEARFPDEPDPGLGMYVSDLSPLWPTFGEFSIPAETVHQQPGRIVSRLLEGQPDNYWQGACYYGVHYEGWAAQTGIIESSRSGEIMVGDRTRCWWFGTAYGGGYSPEEGRGMIVGHMNALNRPGEWHWQDGILYLIPFEDQEPSHIEAKRRQLAFDLSGREHVRIEGLSVRAASVRMQDAAWCTFERCDLSYISHYTRHYGVGEIETGRDTIKSGETGIFVGGHNNSFLSCSLRISAGAGFHLRGYHHTIHNCLIDEVNYTSHYLNAITDAVGDFNDYENFLVGGHVITYNTMRNAGRHFFNFYGNGPSMSSRTRSGMDYMATLFAHNHLYNGMLQTKDAGLITGYYCSAGTLNGLNSQVVYNVLHESYDLAAMRWNVLGLIYLDAGTCDVDLHHNLLWAAPGSLQRGLWFNTMCVDVREHDNIFHPEFTRTCAELVPADFPEGRPFRFGHDFDNPPPVAQWPPLERQVIHPAEEAPLADLQDGDAIALGVVDFDQGWSSVVMDFASGVTALNSDRAARQAPRHQKTTDPLVLEAVTNDGAEERVGQQWTFIRNVRDGAWVRFAQVPLGEGYRRFRAVYGNDQETPGRLEVRLDAVDGPLVSQLDLPQTDRPRGGSVQIYAEAVGEVLPPAQGTRDVFLVFRTTSAKMVGEFEYFRFEQYRGEIPLQPAEVRFELRAGGPQGERLGVLYPRFTGGAGVYRDMVATLEPARGKQPLYLVVRSALPGPLGTIRSLRLEKAQANPVLEGISAPPLMRDGKMVLPQPTHRPCARPGDNYPPQTGTRQPRPVFAAQRLARPPLMDGLPDEALTGGRTMLLKESWDGSRSAGLPSQAWIGYDEEALYIAAQHPVKDVQALEYADHVWGATDAMEVAIQDGFATPAGPIVNLYGWPDGHMVSSDQGGAPPDVVARVQQAVTYRAVIGADTWFCEWRIPFAALGCTPRTAPLLRFNLGVRKMNPEAWVIWRGTGGATCRVANAGVLAFPAELAASGPPAAERLEVWLDAADPDSVVTDEGGRVGRWRDRSGRGRDAVQQIEAFRPLYEAAALNGKPALRFVEEAFTRLELPDLAEEKTTVTVFAVFSNPEPGAEVNHDPRIITASDGQGYDYLVGIAAAVPGMDTGGPRQDMWTFQDRWARKVRVGCFSPLYQTYFKGLISEILVYQGVLSEAQREHVRAYLALKWGLE